MKTHDIVDVKPKSSKKKPGLNLECGYCVGVSQLIDGWNTWRVWIAGHEIDGYSMIASVVSEGHTWSEAKELQKVLSEDPKEAEKLIRKFEGMEVIDDQVHSR